MEIKKIEFQEWNNIIQLLLNADDKNQLTALLDLLLTSDEKNTILTRLNILHALIEGKKTQRELCQLLGVGIATVTRGSNEIKKLSDDDKKWLMSMLDKIK